MATSTVAIDDPIFIVETTKNEWSLVNTRTGEVVKSGNLNLVYVMKPKPKHAFTMDLLRAAGPQGLTYLDLRLLGLTTCIRQLMAMRSIAYYCRPSNKANAYRLPRRSSS